MTFHKYYQTGCKLLVFFYKHLRDLLFYKTIHIKTEFILFNIRQLTTKKLKYFLDVLLPVKMTRSRIAGT